jgi:hypothetical protein
LRRHTDPNKTASTKSFQFFSTEIGGYNAHKFSCEHSELDQFVDPLPNIPSLQITRTVLELLTARANGFPVREEKQ